jgi:glyoxylase-like metal-dependent hydrolase (beta-lactamase superfamily II)
MARATTTWEEVGTGVFRRRHPNLDLNVGLILGDDEVLLIDTRSGPAEARDLSVAIRKLTVLPVRHVVNTHFHFDHTFGNAQFLPARIWGHPRCAAMLAATDSTDISHLSKRFTRLAEQQPERATALTDLAADIRAATIAVPTELVAEVAVLTLGGRRVELHHLGRGHTDGDLIVAVPDADVVFAGDLVEESGEPDFGDAWPLEWPSAVLRLLRLGLRTIVPGHGALMDMESATAQAEQLVDMAHLCTLHLRGGLNDEGVLRRAPFDPRTAIVALHRAKATLARATRDDAGVVVE